MEIIIKICIVSIVGIIIISLVKVYKPELTVETVLCTSIIILWLILDSLKESFAYISEMYSGLSYGKEYFPIIIKVLAISYITEFTASLCKDAKEEAISKKVELAGKVAIFVVAIPIFTSLMNLLESIV